MVSNDVYPVSLDVVTAGGSLLAGIPTDFKVKFDDETEYSAQFLGKDDQAKVAFVKLENFDNSKPLPYVIFQKTNNLGITDSVYILELLNQNYNFQTLFTTHRINAVIESPRRKFLVNNYTPALSAGGLVLNAEGKAIGVTIKQDIDFSFAPPGDFEEFHKDYLEISPAEWFVELIENPPNIEKNQISQKSWLGIRMQALSEELQKYWNVPQAGGVVINQIFPESPAEKSRLQVGDVILAIEDSVLIIRKDEETSRLRNIIFSKSPGTSLSIKLFRKGKIITKKIELTPAPKSVSLAKSLPVPHLGFEIRELTRDIIYQENLPLETPGVFVYQVDRASPAGIAGLQIGEIIQEFNGKGIKSFNDAVEILQEVEKEPQDKYMLKVLSNKTTRFVFLDLQK
jgi:serine protease Do